MSKLKFQIKSQAQISKKILIEFGIWHSFDIRTLAFRIEGFTPLESPSIYAGDGGNRKHQLLIEGGVKALPFLTGFT